MKKIWPLLLLLLLLILLCLWSKKDQLLLTSNAAHTTIYLEKGKADIHKLLETDIIEFDVGKDTLTPTGIETLAKLATILNTYENMHVEIAGHTDSDGDDQFNQNLSQNRVDSIKNTLHSKFKIQLERLNAVGYGETQPLVPNTTDENKKKNRRVEINIIGE